MAIQITFTDPDTGITYTDSYHRVRVTSIDHEKDLAEIGVAMFKDAAAAATEGSKSFMQKTYVCSGQDFVDFFSVAALSAVDSNLPKAGYLYLMTLTTPIDYLNDGIEV